jgi:hypothetical protein
VDALRLGAPGTGPDTWGRRSSNTANETMVEDYVQSHLAGNHVFARGKGGHKETLSCFDKTRPIAASKRPGGHGPPRVSGEPRRPLRARA